MSDIKNTEGCIFFLWIKTPSDWSALNSNLILKVTWTWPLIRCCLMLLHYSPKFRKRNCNKEFVFILLSILIFIRFCTNWRWGRYVGKDNLFRSSPFSLQCVMFWKYFSYVIHSDIKFTEFNSFQRVGDCCLMPNEHFQLHHSENKLLL